MPTGAGVCEVEARGVVDEDGPDDAIPRISDTAVEDVNARRFEARKRARWLIDIYSQ